MECLHPEFRMNMGCKKCAIEACAKPLAQYLAIISGMGVLKTEMFFEQAIDAYESTENVKIRIERV